MVMEMYVCNFHNQYDGILGIDILKQINAVIDFESNTLRTGRIQIHLNFENESIETSIENSNQDINSLIAKGNKFCILTDEEKLPIIDQFRIDHLNNEEKNCLLKLIRKFEEIFHNENNILTTTNNVVHEIRTVPHAPISTRSYRYPYIHRKEVNDQIKEMLTNGIIRHSSSPYSAPIWVVPKKSDASGKEKWRIVIDYRKLNNVTIDDKYPIPLIEEILEKLGRCQYFTTLDLAKGYHQIKIKAEDIPKTAFTVEGGHYEFLRMPFGLKTAPATFPRLMNSVFHDYINKFCFVYLDDIIVYSTSLKEHIESLTKVFQRLKDANLKVQLDKSEFFKRETKFLGHVVSNDGIKPNPEKISAIQDLPLPRNVKQIKQFLGLSGYYRKFVKDYSNIARPMIKYLKKDSELNLNDTEYIESFRTLKTILMHEPVLKYPDFSKEFILQTDASNYALGAVLSQSGHPICYASRTLNAHERNYSTIEKELLAIIWAVNYFRPYLFGRKFLIEIDHRPLVWLFNIKEPNSKILRWRIKLSEYNFDIKYKKGRLNGNADALSRLTKNEGEIMHIDCSVTNSNCPLNFYKTQFIFKEIKSGSLGIKTLKIFKNTRKIIRLKTLDDDTMTTLISNHFSKTANNALYFESENLYKTFVEKLTAHTFELNFKLTICKKLLHDIEDENILVTFIEKEHDRNNHRGINENFNQLRERIYHPNLKERITKYINNCHTCNQEKYERKPIKQEYKLTETPSEPKEIVHCDIFYTLNKELFCTFIDKFSKHAQAIKISNRSWVELKKAICQYISCVGAIKKLVVDNELGFKAIPFIEFLSEQNIELHTTSNKNHNSNSDIERLHNTINEHIRILKHDANVNTDTVEEKIYKIINYYNNTIHTTTNKRPIDFLHGQVNTIEYPEIKELIEKRKRIYIAKANENRENLHIVEGNQYIKEERGGKNHSKFKKVNITALDEEHFVTPSGRKYYKSFIKRKKKFQNV